MLEWLFSSMTLILHGIVLLSLDTEQQLLFPFCVIQHLPDLDADEEVAWMTKKKKQRELEVDSLSLSLPLSLLHCVSSPSPACAASVSLLLLCRIPHPSPLSPSQLDWSRDPCRTSPHRLIPTPDQDEDQPVVLINAGFPHYNFGNIFTTPVRCAPLPTLW